MTKKVECDKGEFATSNELGCRRLPLLANQTDNLDKLATYRLYA